MAREALRSAEDGLGRKTLGKARAVMCARAMEEAHDGYGDVVFF